MTVLVKREMKALSLTYVNLILIVKMST